MVDKIFRLPLSISDLWPYSAEMFTIGDSRLALGMLITLNGTDGRSIYTTIQGPQAYLQSQLKGRVWFPADLHFAVSGYNTANMLAISDTVAACRSKLGLMLIGTNNSFSSQGGLDNAKNDVTATLQKLTRAGKRMIVIAELPRGNALDTTNRMAGGSLPFWMEYRKWLLNVVSRWDGVTVVDAWPSMAVWNSTTGDMITGISTDYLHNNSVGYKDYFTPPIFAVLDKWLANQGHQWPSDNTDIWSASNPRGNILTNGMMDGTGGTLVTGITGVLPTSWTGSVTAGWSNGTSMGIVGSKVSGTNTESLQLALSGTAAASTGAFDIRQTITPANLVAGDKVRAFGISEIVGGFTGMREVSLTLIASGGGNTYEAKSMHGSTGFVMPVADYTGANAIYHMTPEITIGATISGASLRLNHVPIASAVISAEVRWRQLGVYKIINEGY